MQVLYSNIISTNRLKTAYIYKYLNTVTLTHLQAYLYKVDRRKERVL